MNLIAHVTKRMYPLLFTFFVFFHALHRGKKNIDPIHIYKLIL